MKRPPQLEESVGVFKHLLEQMDTAGPVIAGPKKPRRIGAHLLALTLVADAVQESFGAPSIQRDEARAWLKADLPLLSAKTCFEALGFEYDAVISKLQRKWASDGA